MVVEWQELPIDNVADVVGGGTPSTKDESNFNGDIPWITPKDLSGYTHRYIARGERNISEKGLRNSSARLLPKGAVLLTTRAPVGYVAIATSPVATNQGFRNLILRDGFQPEFFYYLLKSNTDYLKAHASGTTFGELSGSTLKRLKFRIPPLPKQCAIAHILGTLDDKIELNRQMNQTLEAMAQALFKSWFIDFEPFRDQGMQDSPLGEIPVGWRVGKVNDIAVLHRESINPSDSPSEVFDHYSIPAFDEEQMPKAETGDEIRSNKFRIPYEAVLISKLNPRFPRVWLPFDNGSQRSVCSTEFLVVIPKGNTAREYLYSLFSSHSFLETFSTLVTGTSSSHQRVRPEDLMSIDAIVPPERVATNFSDMVRPLLALVNHNLVQNSPLAAIRDTLLPKLLSGEIQVKNAEKFVEKVI